MDARVWYARHLSPATFQGRHFQVTDAYCNPHPEPQPQFLIGGGGEQKTLRVVARDSDWWNLPGRTPEEYARKVDILRATAATSARPGADQS